MTLTAVKTVAYSSTLPHRRYAELCLKPTSIVNLQSLSSGM